VIGEAGGGDTMGDCMESLRVFKPTTSQHAVCVCVGGVPAMPIIRMQRIVIPLFVFCPMYLPGGFCLIAAL